MADIDFEIEFEGFNEGQSPLAHLDTKTYIGNKGQASEMKADVVSSPGFVVQSPGLVNLTNGNESGEVDELVRFILDRPTDTDETFAVGTSNFFKLSSSEVEDTGWPKAITSMTSGESIVRLNNDLFIFYNRASDGDIAVYPLDYQLQEKDPGTMADDSTVGTESWADVNDAKSRDGDVAYADVGGVISHYLKATNFSFDIPTDATINGINVQVMRGFEDGGDQSVEDHSVKIVKGGSILSFENKASTADWPEASYDDDDGWEDMAYQSYGSKTDLWGTTWLYSDINSSGFGVVISAQEGSTESGGVARIDHIRITVYYTDSSEAEGELTETWAYDNDDNLENALHPAAAKEDIIVFGNGRYVGVYVEGSAALDVQKLDFGDGSEVADIVFHSNLWWIAVNYGEGKRGQIYLYDGSAISNILSDEAGVGDQEIGFLYVLNGLVYVAYNDTSSDGFNIGWLSGRQIKPLRYFSGSLPDYRQKALYKNTIIFASSTNIMSMGASVEQLPLQISTLADGGHSTLGGIASPFGTPMIASHDGSTGYRLAKFSGYATDSNWKSVFVDITRGRMLGKIHTIIVSTKALVGDARCDLKLEGNQGEVESSEFEVSTTDKTRHVFKSVDLKAVEDIRLVLDYANGDTTNTCPIRKVVALGNFVER